VPKGPKTVIEASMLQRAGAALKGFKEGWFGPSEPMSPVVPEAQRPDVEGRQFDYRMANNRNMTPRSEEAIGFSQLRGLADACDILRIVLERRKDQIAKLQWHIIPKDKKAKPDSRCEEVTDFFNMPDKENDWDTWLRMLLEDLFVLDAPTVYVRKTLGGGMYAAEPVDGATIKRILDIHGRTPMFPSPAYQQVLKGVPAINYTTQELIYRPRNRRTNKVYGFSPVEQIIMSVNIAIRRAVHKLQYYTEGNIPEALIGVPENWTADQVAKFQENWDNMLAGNTAERRHVKFVPGQMNIHETKDAALKDMFDEWLARMVCFAFGIDPTPFIQQVNRATSETAREVSLAEGMAPLMDWVQSLINHIIWVHFGYKDLKFDWVNEESISPVEKAQVNQIYLAANVITADEVREDIGKDPFTPEQLAKQAEAAAAKAAAMQSALGGGPGAKTDGPPNQNKEEKKEPAAPPAVVKMGDIYVDVGGTVVKAEFPQHGQMQSSSSKRTVIAKRQDDGSITGEIIETPIVARTVAINQPQE
jgi:hypothetical protein